MIETERTAKKALQKENAKLEHEIKKIKKDSSIIDGMSSRHNESLSMYFAKSQVLSPNQKRDKQHSFIQKGNLTSRAIFMSQQNIDVN